jgi:ATP-dependent protease HslVU (ClpYQ) peptidase subunit
MAADSVVNAGPTRWAATKKIKRLANGALIGMAGDSTQAASLAVMLNRATKANKQIIIEMLEPYDDVSCLYLCKEGVYAMSAEKDKRAGIYKLEGEYFAEGSGLEAALAAMYMGADAELAAMVACEVCNNCGGPVQVEVL